MKIFKTVLLTLLFGSFITSCSSDQDDEKPPVVEPTAKDLTVENFVYRGMNEIYLYKADVPVLANNYFASQEAKDDFLDNYSTPEDLFYDGLVAPQDRFSFIVDDYIELENLFSGVSKTSGLSYGLVRYCASCNEVFAYVRYVLPNTPAADSGLKRGDIINRVNGEQITIDNYTQVFAPDAFTVGLATLDDSTITPLDVTYDLTKITDYNTNPVFIAKTLDVEGQKVGYLMYNSFTADYDPQLNAAFGQFKADGVTDLILDLRYNGGGSVRTATDLASMITGQFPGQLFMKEFWNAEYQAYYESQAPERLLNNFNTSIKSGEAINSLNLSRVYVITTERSASASELVINGLIPYIDVVQVGETTTGKFQASVTLYDSSNFGRQNANSKHTYAIQPLVLKSVNSAGVSDYINGLVPDIEVIENIRTLGVLGDVNEPMLKVAVNAVIGNRISIDNDFKKYKFVGESTMKDLNYQRMYIDKLPALIEK
ncbi:C-terminal processing protease CtpA/Prc [Gillisia mitskevichiae]|uniref:C-terminal processing protease CtpA/Prc n=1 Tax=Gillisia mitskevichiae TaxID=270921 RepID=A0A495PRV7_9FLAO|nr:S41 family peptidase [Gillisia mitskevichiae]RKS53291.1 C-terminal processing protease CtpA/Prc [Gillisia mitskevichiae]